MMAIEKEVVREKEEVKEKQVKEKQDKDLACMSPLLLTSSDMQRPGGLVPLYYCTGCCLVLDLSHFL